ncbi:MAG: hypothetical protein RBT33_00830 [Candidatus Dojkabacteria bacterium]|nr:hypothetical protein [Candidatus Dojkabacteria bacterium]MDX9738897.1 hypothetical protein [Candidatus Dojkabacteria bacterium]
MFNGGINKRVHPFMLGLTEGAIFKNIDNSSGPFIPEKTDLLFNDNAYSLQKFIYYYKDNWYGFPANTPAYLDVYYIEWVANLYRYVNSDVDYIANLNPNISVDIVSYTGSNYWTLVSLTYCIELFDIHTGRTYKRIYKTINVTYPSWVQISASNVTPDSNVGIRIWRKVDTPDYTPSTAKYFRLIHTTNYNIFSFVDKSDISGYNYLLELPSVMTRLENDIFIPISSSDPKCAPTLKSTSVAEGEGLTGTFTYCYTFYNKVTSIESAPSPYSEEITVEHSIINITIPIAPPPGDEYMLYIYRLGGDSEYMIRVQEIETSSPIVDSDDSNISYSGQALTTYNYPVPREAKYFTEYATMLFAALGNTLRYSEIGLIEAWNPFYSITFENDITGIGATANGLLVFLRNKTYIITGNSPDTLSKFLLDDQQGCIAHKTIKFVSGSLLWQSLDGICTSMGDAIQLVSADKFKVFNYEPIKAVVKDNEYFLFHTTGILALDFRYNAIVFKEYTLPSDIVDVMYITDIDEVVYSSEDKLFKLFKGTSNRIAEFLTGKLSEGSISNRKTYSDIYTFSAGDVTLDIKFDGQLALSVALDDGFTEIKVPTNYQFSYYIELHIKGTGELYEIEYKVEGRQNGR